MLKSLAILAAVMVASPALAEPVVLNVGEVQVVKPDQPVGSVAVGDANVANVEIDADATVMLFGRNIGSTNVLVFDRDHKVIQSVDVRVVATEALSNVIVVREAGGKETFVLCTNDGVCMTKSKAAP